MKTTLTKMLTSPILFGGLASFLFYFAIHKEYIQNPLILRYFAGHPVEYITTIMFFVGAAILVAKYFSILTQQQLLHQSPVLQQHGQKVAVNHTNLYLQQIQQHEKEHGSSVLTRRLKIALNFVKRSGSAEELDTELRYLAEEDAAKADGDYGLVRLILWAVPMLGFLGTVIGITAALDSLDLNTINESSKNLSAGLAVAFDTTGLAIALDVALFFIQFVVYKEETRLLTETDRLTDNELRGRFESSAEPKDDAPVATVKRMLETVINSLDKLTQRQTAVWEQCMSAANERYSQLTSQNAEMLKLSLSSALNESLTHHAKTITQSESQLMERTKEMAQQFNEALKQNAAGLLSLQEETARHTEAVREVMGSSSQLIKLEEQLHDNLTALAQVGNFEETVNSLAAAIHLISGKRTFNKFQRETA